MTVETGFQIAFAAGVVLAAGTLAGAALGRVTRKLIVAVAFLLGAAAVAAWVAFALEPTVELAVAAGGLTVCLLAALGALGLRASLAKAAAIDDQLERARQELDAVVAREL